MMAAANFTGMTARGEMCNGLLRPVVSDNEAVGLESAWQAMPLNIGAV